MDEARLTEAPVAVALSTERWRRDCSAPMCRPRDPKLLDHTVHLAAEESAPKCADLVVETLLKGVG